MTTEQVNPLRQVLSEVTARMNEGLTVPALDPLLALARLETELGKVREQLLRGEGVMPMLITDALADVAAQAGVWAARVINEDDVVLSRLLGETMPGRSPQDLVTSRPEPLTEEALDMAIGAIEGAKERATPGTSRYRGLEAVRDELVGRLRLLARSDEAAEEAQAEWESNHR